MKGSPSLSVEQEEKLLTILWQHLDAFTCDYNEMKGVHPVACTHHIYIKEGYKHVRQSQTRMNPRLKDILKEELEKWLVAGFVCPLWDSNGYHLYLLCSRMGNGEWVLIIGILIRLPTNIIPLYL